jgi:hypothetical protein
MALNATRLANAVKTTLGGQGFVFEPGSMNTKFVDALCAALITEITGNAVVTGPVAVTSVAGVTPGGGVSGAGAGNLTAGTIS